jgi:hypothetical protein
VLDHRATFQGYALGPWKGGGGGESALLEMLAAHECGEGVRRMVGVMDEPLV